MSYGRRRPAETSAATIRRFTGPFFDTSDAYKEFIASPMAEKLDEHERHEFQELMVHRIGGQVAITMDRELPELTKSAKQEASAY